MAKTQEELTQLKTEYETLNNKLKELTDEELNVVTGGAYIYNFIENSEFDPCPAVNAQIGDYIAAIDYIRNTKIEVFRLEGKVSDSIGIATKFTTYQDALSNYSIQNNVRVGLTTMGIIHKPNWIKE